jgi:chromosome segregation ATPase
LTLSLKLETTKATLCQDRDRLQANVDELQEQFSTVTATLDALKAKMEAQLLEAAESAGIEHAALVKAQQDFHGISAETEALKVEQTVLLKKTEELLAESHLKDAEITTLKTEIAQLKEDNNRNLNRISELEVEVLELKDSQEAAEDERTKLMARLKSLEKELSQAVVAKEAAIKDAAIKEEQFNSNSAEIQKMHELELAAASEERAKVIANLDALKIELAAAQSAYKQANRDAAAAAAKHAHELEDEQKAHIAQREEFAAQVDRISEVLSVSDTVSQQNNANDVCSMKRRSIMPIWRRSKLNTSNYYRMHTKKPR